MAKYSDRKVLRVFFVIVGVAVVAFGIAIWLIKGESTPPAFRIDFPGTFMGIDSSFSFVVEDQASGLRSVTTSILHNGSEVLLDKREYPAPAFLKRGQQKSDRIDIAITPRTHGLHDGPATIKLEAIDWSWRHFGKGNNQTMIQDIVIDTTIPTISVLTASHNINQGGAGLIAYRLSEECSNHGVIVGETAYPGYTGFFPDSSIAICFFALAHDQGRGTSMHVEAVDQAGNRARTGFSFHIRPKQFKKDRLVLSDTFLNKIMPEFLADVPQTAAANPLNLYLYVNRELRQKNHETITRATGQPMRDMFWLDGFLALPNAQNRAGFADRRTYLYQGKEVDRQVHLGLDLASNAQADIPAGNRGVVILTEQIGIYGQTVMIDHGYGLFSMYSHMSSTCVKVGQIVERGEIIGKTGLTGLAAGDHLHLSFLIHQTFVNPIEWLDAKWIKDNITDKLLVIQASQPM